uniref:(California timema) hypothetical protein n=1 Tax=Timema californicum TaxID=61474 RepID=A0A7R9JJ13_TIMCA|nr:unnamed protein product [Timema californicum]
MIRIYNGWALPYNDVGFYGGDDAKTLRKYPPAPNLYRKCTVPYPIPGTSITLEQGTRVLIPAYAIHHDPEFYPDPEKFNPERFTEENKGSRPSCTYLPFGEGPRICIGVRFGLMQVKVGLATLVRHYRFTACDRTAVPLVLDPRSYVTAAKGGIWLRVTLRD